MDFNNRQYDPQPGRFLQVDPLAAFGGQDMMSPYAAMGNMPEIMVDPLGLSPGFDRAETGVGDRSGGSYAGNLANLSDAGIGGGGGWTTMGGVDLDPNNFFNPQAAFNVLVAKVQQEQAQQDLYHTFSSVLAEAGSEYRIVNGRWVRISAIESGYSGAEAEQMGAKNDGSGYYIWAQNDPGNLATLDKTYLIMRPGVQQEPEVEKGVGQPGFGESLIPVWGSGRAAIDDFQNGRWGWGCLIQQWQSLIFS